MKIIVIIFLLGALAQVQSQTYTDSVYNVEITGTPCPIMSYFSSERYPGCKDHTTFGYGFFIRGMWHPGRLLSVGIMSGYILISNDVLKK